jgi:hypothetical protein
MIKYVAGLFLKEKRKKYRLVEISDITISSGKPYWIIEKRVFGNMWTRYFEEHTVWGNTFYDKDEAERWYKYHCNKNEAVKKTVLHESEV